MRKHIITIVISSIAFLQFARAAIVPIFNDDFESGTMVNWTTTATSPLDPFTPTNVVPPSPTGRWSAYMNVSTDRMHHNIIADNGGAEATGHLMFSYWIYDEGVNGGTVGATRVYNELRAHSGGSGLPNGGTVVVGTLDQLLAAGKFNSVTLPGEVFTTTKYQGRVAFHTPQPVGDTGWFNLNGPGSPNRSIGWHRFDIEIMPGGTTIRFYVDGILCRTFTGATVDTYDTVILGPGLGTQQGNAWIDGISLNIIDDPPTIVCPPDQTAIAASSAGAVVNYPAPTAADDRGTPTVVCNPPSGSTFPIGTTAVTCVATDSAGQTATCSFAVIVRARPVDIACPKNIVVKGNGPTAVNYPPPTIVVGDCAPITVNCNPPSGSNFPLGSTVVNCVATDACGTSDRCRFIVTVRSITPPWVNFPTDHLLPPEGMYSSGSEIVYANRVIADNVIHHNFSASYPPPASGESAVYVFSSEVDFDYSTDDGASYQHVSARAEARVHIARTWDEGASQVFDTEMLSLDISGGTLPPGVMLRESPTRASSGKLKMQPGGGGGALISSFFDVFTELSLDGGMTWSPSEDADQIQLAFDPTKIPPIESPEPNLPPRNDVFTGPAGHHLSYGDGIIIRDVRHRYPTQSLPPPAPGEDRLYEFQSLVDFQLSMDGGHTWRAVRAPALNTMLLRHIGGGPGIVCGPCTFEAEMLQLDISGGDLPQGVMLRESPTRASMGGTARMQPQAPLGTHHIHSFFDVFTELSVNGGNTWQAPADPLRIELQSFAPEVDQPNDLLPPPGGTYANSALDAGISWGDGMVRMRNIRNHGFTQSLPPPNPGESQLHQFDSTTEFELSTDGGQSWMSSTGIAHQVVKVDGIIGPDMPPELRHFDTEMLQLNIGGAPAGGGVMIRESPTRASLGRTSIRQLQPGGPYGVSSFFDIFTELSINGGQTWMPADGGAVNMVLVPNRTEGTIVCADGRPLANCQVTIQFTNQYGGSVQTTSTTDANGYFNVGLNLSGPHGSAAFVVSSPCCGHIWVVPSNSSWGNLGTLVCEQCGQQSGCTPPPPDMVDWWTFDETTGVIANDTMGFNNQGGRQNGPAVVTGKVRNALCFNGANQYVHVLNHPEVNFFGSCLTGVFPESFTIDAWIKTDSNQGLMTIMDKRINPQAPKGYSLFVNNGQFGFQMADGLGGPLCGGGGACNNYLEPTPTITPGVWHHVAVVVQRCDVNGFNVGRLYVNGVIRLTFTPRMGDISNSADLFIAMRQPAFGYNFFRGCIDEVEIFKRALRTDEIRAIYNAGNAGKCKPCISIECPGDIKVWTCDRSTNICFTPAASGTCGQVSVVCTPPSCSTFQVGTTPVNCEARDTSGNKTNCTFNVTVVQDSAPPVISCPDIRIERWMCSFNAGAIVTWVVSATDDCDQNVSITCVPPSGSMFTPGVHTVICTARDDCGKTDQCSFQVTVVEDKTPPVIVCPGDIKQWICDSNGTRVSYVISVSDDYDPSPTVTCSPPSGGFFPVGTTTVLCVARDKCGNQSQCSFDVTIVQDTRPPILACPADILFDDCKERSVRFDVVATDDCDPNPGVVCTPPSGTVFQPGTTTIVTCMASDQCGHRVECSFKVEITCRCVPPPADLVDWWTFDEPVGSAIANDISGFNNIGVHVNGPTVVVGKVKNALCFNGDNQYVQVRDHPEVNFFGDCANDVAESFTIDAWIRQDSNAVQGVRTFVDKRNNPASPQGYSFYVVNGRLGFQLGNGVGNNSCNAAGAACFNYVEPTASITPGVWHFVAITVQRCHGSGILYVDGSPVLTFTPLGGDYNNPADLYIGVRNPAFGAANFRGCIDELEIFKRALSQAELQSIYNAGSAGKCKPCIRCPDDITVETCDQGTNVCYQVAVSEDCHGLQVRCNPPPCSFFPANTSTLVTCEAIDPTGVVVERCQFAVTVLGDTRPPTINCPADITGPNDPGACGAKVDYVRPQASDNCPGVTVSCLPPPGSFFPVAATLVTCTATDASGQTASCTFSVIVRDIEPPRIVCPPDIRRDGCHETVVDYAVNASDNCPALTVTCVPPSGSPFPVGSTPVTCTATDGSGNTASCTFKVEIVCPCVPPPAGMVDWWPFDEAAGPVANDIAGFNNQGVHMNGPTVIAGKVRNALCFNGDNQYVEVRDHPEVNFLGSCNAGAAPAESFTIDAWIRADSIQSVATILDKRVNPSDPIGYSLFIANGRLAFQMADGSGGGGVCGPSASCQNYGEPTPSITVGNWHFVAVTVQRCDPNGGAGTGRLYVDGNLVLTFTPRKGNMNNPANLLIGVRQPAFGGANFRGCIDELEYFKRALSQAELQAIYSAGSNGKCKPCLRCPDDITVKTCARGTNVCYQVPENCPGLQVRCTPPPCSFFPANTSTLVVCEGINSTGQVVERCQFAVTVITPQPRLEVVYLGNGLVRICWVTDCPGWSLQCTRSLVPPIMWQFVSAPVTVTGNRYCVTLPAKGLHQFYRLCRRDVKEIDGQDGLFPPLGVYRSPDDLVTPYSIGGDPDRPLLMRKFAYPIPATAQRRPPPCATCPPDLYQIQTQLSFQVSLDGGETWMDGSAASDATVQAQASSPPEDGYDTEILRLDAQGQVGGRQIRIRESPTRPSLGRATVGAQTGTIRMSSFFDVFTEISLDDGQTWYPAETPVPMDLMRP